MVQTTTTPDAQREGLWRRRLADQATSGMTIAQWCRQNGVSGSLFHYWRRALAGRDAHSPKLFSSQAAAKNNSQIPEADFARVVIAAPTAQPDSAASVGESAIEIELPGRGLVRVGAGFGEATLARVLAVLEGRSC